MITHLPSLWGPLGGLQVTRLRARLLVGLGVLVLSCGRSGVPRLRGTLDDLGPGEAEDTATIRDLLPSEPSEEFQTDAAPDADDAPDLEVDEDAGLPPPAAVSASDGESADWVRISWSSVPGALG